MSMVEKVARAICEENGDDWADIPDGKSQWTYNRGEFGGRFRDINEPMRCDYIEMARAAIEAMREPVQAQFESVKEKKLRGMSFTPFVANHIWQAMIDAALEETE